MRKIVRQFILNFALIIWAVVAFAGTPLQTTFQTRIMAPNGNVLEAPSVNFRFTILDSSGTCALFVEDYVGVNMSDSQGVVSFPLGTGVKQFPLGAVAMHEVFNNSAPFFSCQAGGTFTPNPTDRRQVVMQFNDGNGWQTLPQMAINSVPYSNYANRAENLGPYPAADYMRTAMLPVCVPGQALYYNGASLTCTAVSGGSTYTGVTNIANVSGDITLAPAASTGAVIINSNTPSVSTTTGSMVVTGGVGISGAINSAGNIASNGIISAVTSMYTPQLFGTSTPGGNISIDGTSDATTGNVLLAANGGKVGIGTTTPSGILHVEGGFAATATNATNITVAAQAAGSGNQNGGHIVLLPGAKTGTGQPGAVSIGTSSVPAWVNSNSLYVAGTVYSSDLQSTNKFTLGDSSKYIYHGSSGATGYLNFFTNSTEKMRIDGSGNVGIGTTTPSSKLSVFGDVNITGNYLINGSPITSVTPVLSGISSISNSSGDITLAPITTTGAVLINSGTASLGTNSGALVVSGGIGATGALNVGGNLTSGGIISAQTSMYSPQLYGTSTPGGNINIDGSSNATKGNVLLAATGGKVGIGMASPQRILDVNGLRNGTGTATATGGSSTITGSGTLFTSEIAVGDSIQFSGDARTVISVASDTSLGIDTPYPATYSNSAFTIRKPIALNTGAAIFGDTTAARVHTSNIFGDVVPVYEFVSPNTQAWSSFTDLMVFRHKNSGTFNVSQPQRLAFLMKMGNEAGTSDAYGGGGMVFETSSGWMANPTLSLINGNARQLTITSAGNVGIGQTAPTAKLDVAGSIVVNGNITTWGSSASAYAPTSTSAVTPVGALAALTNTSNTDNTGSYIVPTVRNTATTNQRFYMGAISKSAGYTPEIVIGQQTGATAYTERIRVNSSGYVGIGTTTPGEILHLSSGGNTSLRLESTPTGKSGYITASSGGSVGMSLNTVGGSVPNSAYPQWSMSLSGSDFFAIERSPAGATYTPTRFFHITNGGYVGIGTSTPQTTLQVAGVISPATNNTYTLGNATYRFTEVYATNGVINTSDRREKKQIDDSNLGLEFINQLRPVSYRWNTGVDEDIHYGLIAQETEEAIAQVGQHEKTSIVTHDEKTDRYGVRYSELISPLIKAAQELYQRIVGIEREVASVKAKAEIESAAKEKEIERLKQENAAIKAYLCRKDKEAEICK